MKIVIENYPEGQTEQLDAVNNPEDPAAGSRQVPFSRELYVEQDDFMENAPKKFYRLSPGKEVRLRYAYFVTCSEAIKDANGNVVELRCTYDPASRGGNSPDGRKVQATLHWVSAPHAVRADVRVYNPLFTRPDPGADGDILADVNPSSLEVLTDVMIEPALAKIGAEPVQFERQGYSAVTRTQRMRGWCSTARLVCAIRGRRCKRVGTMTSNLDRFKKDLACLIEQGDALHHAMQRECLTQEFNEKIRKTLGDEKAKEFIEKLPDFKTEYEAWYSESLMLIRQVLPDRVSNFTQLYEKPKVRKSVDLATYVIQDYMQGLTYSFSKAGPSAAIPQFRQQLAILRAAERRFESSLFEIRQLLQADLFDSEIETARGLLKNGFVRPAGALAGV